ncbi:PIG-L family deacetylase [Caldithrix abyssi]|nr:PIG-L family deacetylase [Caldithrix abyssi]
MNYLVLAAHPDDEVLGCGGSMAEWSKDGHEVHVLIMAEGATSRDKTRDRESRKADLSHLARSARKAGDILGIASVEQLGYPDNRMDSVDLLEVVKLIEEQIKKIKPGVVVTHHSSDLNIDHQVIHQAVLTACRPQPGHPVKRILTFEVPSATEWNSPNCCNTFVPNWFEDISDMLELKIKALEAYETEMREWPHARSIQAVKHLARWRGASVGCEAAEAFMLVREMR